MAKKFKQNTNDKPTKKKQTYNNPVETLWGKIIVWILLFGMVGLIIISSIWAIWKGITG